MTAIELIQRHFEAYNAHALDEYVATCSDSVELFRLPSLEPVMKGKADLSTFYATKRFNIPALRAELLNRIVLGNTVIDHERVCGLSEKPTEAVLAYEIADGLIQRIFVMATS